MHTGPRQSEATAGLGVLLVGHTIYRWIAPDLSHLVWLGSRRITPIEDRS
jgi:hypothetical protein